MFRLGGQHVRLEEVSARAAVYFRSMRLNRALGAWNVEVTVTNASPEALAGPFVLVVEGLTNTTGLLEADGDVPGGRYIDLAPNIPTSTLRPGEGSQPRTLTLGRWGTGSPVVRARVYARAGLVESGVALVRSLGEAGQPLPGVTIEETGPLGQRMLATDPAYGLARIGQGAGDHVWKFSRSGYLPVWRREPLGARVVQIISPRLVPRGTNTVTLTPLTGGVVSNAAIQITFPPGAVNSNQTATLTPLTGQTLPALLPAGWSPVQAFWLELPGLVSVAPALRLQPWGPLKPGETTALVRWHSDTLQWQVVRLIAASETNSLGTSLPGPGAYALVVPDPPPNAPPAPELNAPLLAASTALPAAASLTAGGTVQPASSPASLRPELVTGWATVNITNQAGALSSGYVLRAEVSERYRLADGTRQVPPAYEHFIVGYQRPGDDAAATVQAVFPIRPLRLFGATDLDEAVVRVTVLSPGEFDGVLLSPAGGQIGGGDLRLIAAAGMVDRLQPALLRMLDAAEFTDLACGWPLVRAFDLSLTGLLPGGELVLALTGAPTNAWLVLGRVIHERGVYGLEPVARLRSDAQGRLTSLETNASDRLPGITGPGQYLLLEVSGPQTLVRGVARNAYNQPAGGLLVRLGCWSTLSRAPDGQFDLIAAVGEHPLAVTDLDTGDTGQISLAVQAPELISRPELGTGWSGPRVASITPPDGAVNVTRVTSVTIQFSRPINPATVLAGAIELRDTAGQPVAATLSLNLANTVVTLLPLTVLEPATQYTVALSTNIADLNGRGLEGTTQFTFTTVALSMRDPAAQLIIYEPGATNVPAEVLAEIPAYQPGTNRHAIVVHGTPGTADPEVPVVLVNESSGETATVLSKPDGRFTSVIEGTERDYISATFINLNGTRVYVPVSRQQFDNGFVGLYAQGGILEAQSDGGPVRVQIEPQAIPTRAKVRLQTVTLAELLELLEGVQPDGGTVAGGALKLEIAEGEVSGPIQVRFPVNLLALGYPSNEPPEQAAVALTLVRDTQGVKTFEVLDRMTFTPNVQLQQAAAAQAEAASSAAGASSGFMRSSRANSGALSPSLGRSEGQPVSKTPQAVRPTTAVQPSRPLPARNDQAAQSASPGSGVVSPASAGAQGLGEDFYYGVLDAGMSFVGRTGLGVDIFHYVVVPVLLGTKPVVIKGKVVQAPELEPTGNVVVDPIARVAFDLSLGKPLGGAFVILRQAIAPVGMPGRLQPGMIYATSGADGQYLMVAPTMSDAYVITATHPQFQDSQTEPVVGLFELSLAGAVFKHFVFREPLAVQSPPRVNIAHSPLAPAPQQDCTVQINAAQGPVAPPRIIVQVASATPLAPGIELEPGDVELVDPVEQVLPRQRKRWTGTLKCKKAARVVLRVLAVSANGLSHPTIHYPIEFSGPPPVPDNPIPPSDPQDRQGPYVIATLPVEGGYLDDSGGVTVVFNEPIDRLVTNHAAGIVLSGPAGYSGPVLRLSADQQTLTVHYTGLRPESEYTLTLSGQSIRDLSGNGLDQKPSSPELDNFTVTFKTPPVARTPLAGLVNGRGAAIHGSRLYVLDQAEQDWLLTYDISTPSHPVLVGRTRLLGTPRDLVVIPSYSYKLGPDQPVQTTELVVVAGGDLTIRHDEWGNVSARGQYLQVFDLSDPTNSRVLASPIVSYRIGSAVTKVQWSPPYIIYQEFGADLHQVGFVNLQEMLWGFAASRDRIDRFPEAGREGVDANGDGDYVDPGDTLPIPPRRPVEFFGKKFGFNLAEGTTQKATDFAFSGGVLGVTLTAGVARDAQGAPTTRPVPPAYRTVLFNGQQVDPASATVAFEPGAYPRRVSIWVLGVELDGQIQMPVLALVSLTPDADGTQKLAVIDITLPETPRLLNKIAIPDPAVGGQLQSVNLRSDQRLELVTSRNVLLLDPRWLAVTNVTAGQLHPAICGFIPGAGASTRSVGSSEVNVWASAEAAQGRLVQTAPPMAFVSFPESGVVVDPAALAQDPAGVEATLGKMRLADAIIPARVRGAFAAQSDLSPPQPAAHYHVLIWAPGGSGFSLTVGLESLNAAGHPLPNPGLGLPPVRAVAAQTLAALKQEPRPGCGAPIRPLTARRLSDDPASPYYNCYLSKPFVVVAESVSLRELSALQAELDREILWGGAWLRAFIDPAEASNPAVGPFAAQVDAARKLIRPVAQAMARTMNAHYAMGANPTPVTGAETLPGTAGRINAHSGEYRMETVDMTLPSPRMPIVIQRAVGGQDAYEGPFGPGWDFNYHQRLTELDPQLVPEGLRLPLICRSTEADSVIAGSRDILFHTGEGRVIHFRWVSHALPPEYAQDPLVRELDYERLVADYYLPEKGFWDLLVRFKDGAFERLTPEGMRFRYNPRGQLETIIDRFPVNRHQLEYDRNGWLVRIDDRSVPSDRYVEFGYYRSPSDPNFTSGLDEVTDNAWLEGKICRLRNYAGADVLFGYDDKGLLIRREGVLVDGENGGFAGRSQTHYLYEGCVLKGESATRGGSPLFVAQTAANAAGAPVAQAGDGLGGPVQISVPLNNSAARLQDAVSRITQADGSTVEYTFDRFGYPRSVKLSGPNGREVETQHQYNEFGQQTMIRFAEGRIETMVYDTNNPVFRSRGNLLSVTVDPGPRGGPGYTVTFGYDPRYNLLSGAQTDANGKTLIYTLQADGREVASIQYGDSGVETFTYNQHGQLTQHTDVEGVETAYAYDPATGFLTARWLGPNRYSYDYDGSYASKLGEPASITPPEGAPFRFRYNRRLQEVEAARNERISRHAYDEQEREVYRFEQVGHGQTMEITLQFDGKGFMTRSVTTGIEVNGTERSIEYVFTPDARGRVKSVLHPNGALETYEYDNRGDVTKLTVGDYIEEYSLDAHGNVLEVKKGGTVVVTAEYDGLDRPVRITHKTGTEDYVLECEYFPAGQLKSTRLTDPRFGVVREETFSDVDELGRVGQVAIGGDTVAPVFRYVYEPFALSIVGPRQTTASFWNTAGYQTGYANASLRAIVQPDSAGRVRAIVRHEQGATYSESFTYDELDHRTSVADDLGLRFSYVPRADGACLEVVNAVGHRTTLQHSVLGEKLSRRRQDGMELRYRHDAARNLTYSGDPAAGFEYRYDNQFRLQARRLRNGAEIQFGNFDARNRPQTITLPGGVMTCRYDLQGRAIQQTVTYQATSYSVQTVYDALGRERVITYQQDGGPQNTITCQYDKAGPVLSTRFQQDGADFTVRYGYYPDGTISNVTYPSGVTVYLERDGSGRLIALTEAAGDIVRVVQWQGNNQPRIVQFGSVIQAVNQFDPRGRLIASRVSRQTDQAVLAHLRYQFDPADNLLVRQFVHRHWRADQFEYDAGERLSRARLGLLPTDPTLAGPVLYERTYTYHSGGLDYLVSASTTATNGFAPPPFAEAWTGHDGFLAPTVVNGFNRGPAGPMGYVQQAQLYVRGPDDGPPQFVAAGLTHNGLSQLVRISRADGVSIENYFQPDGLRHGRRVTRGGQVLDHRSYVYDAHDRLLEEYDRRGGSPVLLARYYYMGSDAPVAADILDQHTGRLRRFYYIRDVTLSVVALVAEDGTVVERVSYDPFGQPWIEQRDTAAPVMAKIVQASAGALLVAMSEPVAAAADDPGPGTGILVRTNDVSHAITVWSEASQSFIEGTVVLEPALTGFAPSSVLRFTPSQTVTGTIAVRLSSGALVDEWDNRNAAQQVSLTLTGSVGTVYYQAPEPWDTSPVRLARSQTGSPFLFHGQYFDYHAGLLYLRARFYDPFSGMFLEPDPLGYEDSVNLYAAFAQNPTSRRDPTGLSTSGILTGMTREVVSRKLGLSVADRMIVKASIDDLVRLGRYSHCSDLYREVFEEVAKDPNQFAPVLRQLVKGHKIRAQVKFTPFRDMPAFSALSFTAQKTRNKLRELSFVQVKQAKTLTKTAGGRTVVKTDPVGGSEIWVRLHVNRKGQLLDTEAVRIDELGNPVADPGIRKKLVKGIWVACGEMPHFHKELIENPSELGDYVTRGLQKPNPNYGKIDPKTGQIDTKATVYDTPTTYSDMGQRLYTRGGVLPADLDAFYEASHPWLKFTDPVKFLTPF